MAFVLGVSASDIALVLISNVFTELFSSTQFPSYPDRNCRQYFPDRDGHLSFVLKKVKVDDRGQQIMSRFRKRDYANLFLSGFFMNMLNPAIFLFWITTSTTLITHTVDERS